MTDPVREAAEALLRGIKDSGRLYHDATVLRAALDATEAPTDSYGRCLPPCACPDCGRPRKLAQKLVAAIGSNGPENAEDTVARAVTILQLAGAPTPDMSTTVTTTGEAPTDAPEVGGEVESRETMQDALDAAAALFYGPLDNGVIADELMKFRAAGVEAGRREMVLELLAGFDEASEGFDAAIFALARIRRRVVLAKFGVTEEEVARDPEDISTMKGTDR